MTNKNQRYVGVCSRCQRRVATTVNRREERNLRTAIANLDAIRKSVQEEQGDD